MLRGRERRGGEGGNLIVTMDELNILRGGEGGQLEETKMIMKLKMLRGVEMRGGEG